MAEASEYLLEIEAHDGTALRIIRLSTSGYVTGPNDNPADAEYPAKIVDPGTFKQSMFSENRTMGQAQVGYGEIVVTNADGELDSILNYGVDGRAAVLKRLPSRRGAYASAETIMRATLTRADSVSAWTELRFRLYDRLLELDKPLQSNRYAGTTVSAGATANGSPDLKDRIKPLVFGRANNIELICVNPFNLLYQASDGPVVSITGYDGGIQLRNAGDFPSIAALIAASIPGGSCGTCLTLGLVRFGGAFTGKPGFVFTADVVEGATLAQRSASAVAQRILAKMGIAGASLVASSFTALQAAAPQEVGIYISDETTALAALSMILGSVGASIVPNALGQFEVQQMRAPGVPVFSLTMDDILTDQGGSIGIVANPDTDAGLPAWRVVLRHSKIYRTHSESEVGPCAAERRIALGSEYREVRAESAAVRTKHLLAPELTIETLLTNAADAASEAARRLALYSVRRDVLSFPVRRDDAVAAVLGATGTVTMPRLSYQSGRNMVVIGRTEDPANERVVLTLWG